MEEKPRFTSDDGVKMHIGNTYYSIPDFGVGEIFECTVGYSCRYPFGIGRFASKEAAETALKMMKK